MTTPNLRIPYGYCHCGCGNLTKIAEKSDAGRSHVRGEPIKFICGHTLRENSRKSMFKQIASRTRHGHNSRGTTTKTYQSWYNMKARCLRPTATGYCYYGGRGITVCDRWMDFKNFLADMGEKPDPKLTIERINNNGNYEPGNCKWATHLEQSGNKRPRKRREKVLTALLV